MPDTDTYSRLLRVGEVAEAFGVTAQTVRAWADEGKITVIRTPSGHRKFLASEIEALLPSRGDTP